MSVQTEKIRNIALAGHGSTGKTSLMEQLLFTGDLISKPETLDSGKTVSDYTEEEIERKMSVHTTLAGIPWNDHKINVLDTPGASDFIGEVVPAFRVAESVVMLLSAEAGIQIETIKLWRMLDKRNKPRVAFINKVDKERASFDALVKDINEKFGITTVPVTLPIGVSDQFKGIVDVLHNKAYLTPGFGEKEKESSIPEEMQEAVEEAKLQIIEAAAEGSDELMEKYFEDGTLSDEDIIKGLALGFSNNMLIPVFCGASDLGSGITALLNGIVKIVPHPGQAVEYTQGEEDQVQEIKIASDDTLSAFVFKSKIDQFSGKMSFIKVVNGELTGDSEIYNLREQQKERITKVYTPLGKKVSDLPSLAAGDLGVLTKLDSLAANDTVGDHNLSYQFAPLDIPQPVHAVTISAESKKDEDRLNQFLHRASLEDLTFQIDFNKETKETVIAGMGELHLNMILDTIKDKQKINMNTKVPKVAYRETINKSADAEYTHKKQSGGHGQFGRVVIHIRPLERGKYYEFDNAIKGGSVSKGYIPGVEKGLHDAMESGILAGYPVVDIGITLVDGKEHPVDSSEMSFRLAAKGALQTAIKQANPVLLEPINSLKVFTDEEYVGDILSDLSSRRGRVMGQNSIGGGIQMIEAEVPQAELLRYSIDLRSITSGTASFEMEFDHYSPISGKIADDVITASKAEQGEES